MGASGVASLRRASKQLRYLAAIPLIFAVQQFAEAVQWLVPHPSIASTVAGYIFLFFALLLWPVYFPLAILLTEPSSKKNILGLFAGIGLIESLFLFSTLVTRPLEIQLLPKGIFYNIDVPWFEFWILLYAVIVCVSPLFSSHKLVRWFGFFLALSAVFSAWFFNHTFISVWCFFAAVLSGFIYFGVRRATKKTTKR